MAGVAFRRGGVNAFCSTDALIGVFLFPNEYPGRQSRRSAFPLAPAFSFLLLFHYCTLLLLPRTSISGVFSAIARRCCLFFCPSSWDAEIGGTFLRARISGMEIFVGLGCIFSRARGLFFTVLRRRIAMLFFFCENWVLKWFFWRFEGKG